MHGVWITLSDYCHFFFFFFYNLNLGIFFFGGGVHFSKRVEATL